MCTHTCVHVSLCAESSDPGGPFLLPYSALALKLTFPIRTGDLGGLEFVGAKDSVAGLGFWAEGLLSLGTPLLGRPDSIVEV